jgi:hypothetical protein
MVDSMNPTAVAVALAGKAPGAQAAPDKPVA